MVHSAQRHAGKLALADLQHIGASAEFEALVADHIAVDTHTAAIDQSIAFATAGSQTSRLEQGANAHRHTTHAQGQADLLNDIGNTAFAAVDEVLLGCIGRRNAVKTCRDFLG